MATFQNLTFYQGETWPIEFDCVDEFGNEFTPDAVAFRLASQTGVLIDLVSPSSAIVINGSSVELIVANALADQPAYVTSQVFIYETRAFVFATGRSYDQVTGTIRVRPSIFAQFPFTPPMAAGTGEGGDSDMSEPGNASETVQWRIDPMKRLFLAGVAALAMAGATHAAAPTETPYAIRDANSATKTECTIVDAAGNFEVCHFNYIWNGTGPTPMLADPTSGYLGVTVEGSVAVGGSVSVSNLPATQAVSATSLPLPAGAATAAGQPALNGDGGGLSHITNFPATQPVSGSVSVSNLPSTQAIQGVAGGTPVPVSLSAAAPGASTAALQSSTQAAAGSSSSAATGVQGVAGGLPVSVTMSAPAAGSPTLANQNLSVTAEQAIQANTANNATATLQTAGNASLSTIATNTAPGGTGGTAAVPTPSSSTTGVALAAGAKGTRIYLPASSSTITYAVESTAVCGVSAPATGATVTLTGPGFVDENLTSPEAVCELSSSGAISRAF